MLRHTTTSLLAAAALVVTAGCDSAGVSGAGAAAVVESPAILKAEGALATKIDNKDISLDLSQMKVTADVVHRINKDKGFACVPGFFVTLEKADGTCKLELDFKAGFEGEGLLLETARFHAKLGLKQDGKVIGTVPCEGWTKEVANGEVVYAKSAGEGKITFGPLQGADAASPKPRLKVAGLSPSGEITMKFKGRQFKMDLAQIKFQGEVFSQGSGEIACLKSHQPFPAWELPDVNSKSPSFEQTIGLNTYIGKRVVVLMGASWCNSCVAQAKSMEKIAKQLAASGKDDFQMTTIDSDPTSKSQAGNISALVTFPVFKGAWTTHVGTNNEGKTWPGKKNDAFIYGKNGKQLFWFKGEASVDISDFEKQITKYLTAKEDVSYADEQEALGGQ